LLFKNPPQPPFTKGGENSKAPLQRGERIQKPLYKGGREFIL
jgi:hypothetical protein